MPACRRRQAMWAASAGGRGGEAKTGQISHDATAPGRQKKLAGGSSRRANSPPAGQQQHQPTFAPSSHPHLTSAAACQAHAQRARRRAGSRPRPAGKGACGASSRDRLALSKNASVERGVRARPQHTTPTRALPATLAFHRPFHDEEIGDPLLPGSVWGVAGPRGGWGLFKNRGQQRTFECDFKKRLLSNSVRAYRCMRAFMIVVCMSADVIGATGTKNGAGVDQILNFRFGFKVPNLERAVLFFAAHFLSSDAPSRMSPGIQTQD